MNLPKHFRRDDILGDAWGILAGICREGTKRDLQEEKDGSQWQAPSLGVGCLPLTERLNARTSGAVVSVDRTKTAPS